MTDKHMTLMSLQITHPQVILHCLWSRHQKEKRQMFDVKEDANMQMARKRTQEKRPEAFILQLHSLSWSLTLGQ